jgi:hypothetical protein
MVDALKLKFVVVASLLAGACFVAQGALALPVSQNDASTICSWHGGLEDWGAGRTGCKWCETVKVRGKSQTTCHEVQCSLTMAGNTTCHEFNIRGRNGQVIVAPSAGFSPSGVYTPPPHRGPVVPRPPHGGVKYPGGNAPPKGHHPPVHVGGLKPPSGVKTTGGNSGPPVTISRTAGHRSGGHR